MAIKYTVWLEIGQNGHKIYQRLPLQDPPKFTKIGIFGLKYTIWQPRSSQGRLTAQTLAQSFSPNSA
jgi:hypothetical protein